MIDRYIYLRLKNNGSQPHDRMKLAAHIDEQLRSIAQISSLRLGTPADDHARAAWDISLAMTFADAEALGATLVSDTYTSLFDALASKIHVEKAWNFRIA